MSRGLDNFNSRYVYRVLRPNEDHDSDLTCCAPRSPRTVDQHVDTGLKDPSRFISTTSSRERALKWLETANEKSSWRHGNTRDTIVRIDVDLIKRKYPTLADSAYDLTEDRNRNYFLKTVKQRKFSAAYSEVVFKDLIPQEAVSLEYIRGVGTVREKKHKVPLSTTKPVAYLPYSTFDVMDNRAQFSPAKMQTFDAGSPKPVIQPSYTYDSNPVPKAKANLPYQTRPVEPSSQFSTARKQTFDADNSKPVRQTSYTYDSNPVPKAKANLPYQTRPVEQSSQFSTARKQTFDYESSKPVIQPSYTYDSNPFPKAKANLPYQTRPVEQSSQFSTAKIQTFDVDSSKPVRQLSYANDSIPVPKPRTNLSYQARPLESQNYSSSKNDRFDHTAVQSNRNSSIASHTAKPALPTRHGRESVYSSKMDSLSSHKTEMHPSISNTVNDNILPDGDEFGRFSCGNDSQNAILSNKHSTKSFFRRIFCCC